MRFFASHFIWLLIFFLPVLSYSQTKQEKAIIKKSIEEVAFEIYKNYFETKKEKRFKVVNSIQDLANKIDSFYSKPHELKSCILNLNACCNDEYIESNYAEGMIFFLEKKVIEKYVSSAINSKYYPKAEIDAIINKAADKMSNLTEKPAAEKPVAEKPVAEKPVAEKPAAEKPAAEKPAAEKPVAEKPVAEKPAAEKPVAEKPAAEKPVAEKPAAEKPVAEKPAAERSLTQVKNELKHANEELVQVKGELNHAKEELAQIKKENESKGGNGLWMILPLLAGFLFYVIVKKMKKRKKTTLPTSQTYDTLSKDKKTPKVKALNDSSIPLRIKENKQLGATMGQSEKWFVVGGSVIGKSHVGSNLPCQDNHYYTPLDNGWLLAVTADGAGSAKKSEIGSKLVAEGSVKKVFVEHLNETSWFGSGQFPQEEEEWGEIAKKSFKRIYDALVNYCINRNDTALKDLACTVIVALVRPEGILVSHIGDGRAGYCNNQNEWKSMITPFKGEEANATIFITSNIWDEKVIDHYIESRVIRESITAFTLLSDGCESHAFECSAIDPKTKAWSDANKPFSKFYAPVIETLKKMKAKNLSEQEMEKKWNEFLHKGNVGLANEPDDKTMIVGFLEETEMSNSGAAITGN